MTLKQEEVKAYFSSDGTVSQWWDPEGDRYGYHFRKEKQILMHELEIDPSWRVLDVGCGQGRYTIWFAHQVSHVTGVDISSEMLQLCRRNADEAGVSGSIDLLKADAQDLSQLEDGQYDVVSCMGTFVHLADPAGATANMARKLKPGGRFLFTFASADSLHGRLMRAYFSSPGFRRLLSGGDALSQVARPLALDDTIDMLQGAGLPDIRVFGIGLLFLFVRPESRGRAAARILRRLSIIEERLKPYYSHHRLVRVSATILGIGTRIESGYVNPAPNGE